MNRGVYSSNKYKKLDAIQKYWLKTIIIRMLQLTGSFGQIFFYQIIKAIFWSAIRNLGIFDLQFAVGIETQSFFQ